MTTATLRATPQPAGDPATTIRIQRALQQPGAKGKKGLLLWVNAAFPKQIADAVIGAAAQHLDPRMVQASQAAASGPGAGNLRQTARTMGAYRGAPYVRRFNGFGYTDPSLMTLGVDSTQVSDSANAAVINATDSAGADPSWVSSVSNALQLVGQAYLTKTQVDAANQIFQTNLQLAQKGLPLMKTNPTAYGLPAPTVNLGVSTSTLTPILVVAGGLGALFLFTSLARKRPRK
jgi:hypothetical protein